MSAFHFIYHGFLWYWKSPGEFKSWNSRFAFAVILVCKLEQGKEFLYLHLKYINIVQACLSPHGHGSIVNTLFVVSYGMYTGIQTEIPTCCSFACTCNCTAKNRNTLSLMLGKTIIVQDKVCHAKFIVVWCWNSWFKRVMVDGRKAEGSERRGTARW